VNAAAQAGAALNGTHSTETKAAQQAQSVESEAQAQAAQAKEKITEALAAQKAQAVKQVQLADAEAAQAQSAEKAAKEKTTEALAAQKAAEANATQKVRAAESKAAQALSAEEAAKATSVQEEHNAAEEQQDVKDLFFFVGAYVLILTAACLWYGYQRKKKDVQDLEAFKESLLEKGISIDPSRLKAQTTDLTGYCRVPEQAVAA